MVPFATGELIRGGRQSSVNRDAEDVPETIPNVTGAIEQVAQPANNARRTGYS